MKLHLAALAIFLAAPALAQNAEPKLLQLELDGTRGYAVVVDGDGHEHHCEANVTRDAVDLGPCKPLRLVTPLVSGSGNATASSAVDGMRETVIQLFEQAGCAISYSDLQEALSRVSELRRKAAAKVISQMTDRGEIADDLRNERAVLKVGNRC